MSADALVVLAPPAPLTLEDLGRIAAGARVALGPHVAQRCAASAQQVAALLRAGRVVYGLNTGCGPLCERVVLAEENAAFQRNLVRSHASGFGPAHPRPVVRATMAVRAFSLAQGRSGVRPAVIETLVAALNAGVHPVIPETGSVGASGDLVELAHVASALMGEGWVEYRGAHRPAGEALAAAGIAPLVYEGREALALMNGTACETAQAALVVLGAEALVAAAEAAAALALEVLGGSPEAFDARVHAARPHPGQAAAAAHLRALLAGSRRLRPEVPCVTGERVAPVQDVVRHAGNCHGQPVALAVDHLKVALAEVALFSERRLARLLDPAHNAGLPPFLIRDRAGVRSGLMGLQYCASSTIADNAVLAHPATLGSVPTNANNQDVVGMGAVGVRQARRLLENARRVVAIELLAAAEAADLVGLEGFAPGTRAVHAAVRERVAPLEADRPLGADVERLAAALEDIATVAA